MSVSFTQLLVQVLDLFLKITDDFGARIIINDGLICNVRGLCCVGQSGQILVQKLIIRIYAGYHQTI